MLYLIAHKVRGKLAFDVATCIRIGQEDVWFIPTSGHRAYPLEFKLLDCTLGQSFEQLAREDWDALPDHYPEPRKGPSLLARVR